MKKYILLLFLSAAVLPADEIPPYSAEFDALAEKPGCTGARVFARPEWKKFFAAAKKDPERFEFLLTRFSVSQSTQIHICNWENASQGVLAVMSAEIITGRSWMSYDGDDPEIKSAVKGAETHFPRHSPLKKLLANPKCCRELQNFFRRAYHGQKQPETPQTQNKIPAALAATICRSFLIFERICTEGRVSEPAGAADVPDGRRALAAENAPVSKRTAVVRQPIMDTICRDTFRSRFSEPFYGKVRKWRPTFYRF